MGGQNSTEGKVLPPKSSPQSPTRHDKSVDDEYNRRLDYRYARRLPSNNKKPDAYSASGSLRYNYKPSSTPAARPASGLDLTQSHQAQTSSNANQMSVKKNDYGSLELNQDTAIQRAPARPPAEPDVDYDNKAAADEWERSQIEWAMKESLQEKEATRQNRLTAWQKTELQEFDPYSAFLEEDSEPVFSLPDPSPTDDTSAVDRWLTTTQDSFSSEGESEEDDAQPEQLQGATASTDTSVTKKKKKRANKKKPTKKDAVVIEPENEPAPVTLSLNFNGAMRIINKAIFLSGGACHLSMLKTRANQTKEFRDYITEKWGTLAEFVQKHPSLLGLTHIEGDKEYTVHLKTQMKLCMHYITEGCKRQDECYDLHLCRDFLLTSCSKKCNFSHDISDNHNQKILHRNHCDDLDIDKIQTLMKKSRTRATAPFICTYYNSQNNCPNFNENQKGFCAYLHVCHHYILGDCRFKEKCSKSHYLFNPQSLGVLRKFGYDVKDQDKSVILQELKQLYSQNTDKNVKKAAEYGSRKASDGSEVSGGEGRDISSMGPLMSGSPPPIYGHPPPIFGPPRGHPPPLMSTPPALMGSQHHMPPPHMPGGRYPAPPPHIPPPGPVHARPPQPQHFRGQSILGECPNPAGSYQQTGPKRGNARGMLPRSAPMRGPYPRTGPPPPGGPGRGGAAEGPGPGRGGTARRPGPMRAPPPGGKAAADMNDQLNLTDLNINTVVSFLVKKLCSAGGKAKLADLMATLGQYKAMWGFIQGKYGSIDAFLDDYGDTISLTTSGPYEGNVVVKTKAKICLFYHQKQGCKINQCQDLHICRHFLLGKCFRGGGGGGGGRGGGGGDRNRKMTCPQSHFLFEGYNKRILEKFHLDHLSISEARMVLKANRCRATVPPVCRLYNSQNGHKLAQNQRCSRLHVCFYYVKGNCRNPKCSKLHGFNNAIVGRLLQQYGFDTQLNADAIRQQISEAMEQVTITDGDSDNDSDSGESLVSTMSMSSVSTTASKKSGKSRPQPKDAAHDREMKTSDEICMNHLNGKCRNLHTKEPFVWQYRDGTVWQAFTDIENCRLENVYSDPKSNSCTLSQGKSAEAQRQVDFVTMEYRDKEMDFHRKVRRLGTRSSVKDSTSANLTEWHWFWQNDQRTWTPFDQGGSSVTSDMLETEYQNDAAGLFTFSVGPHDYAIRFESMTQCNLKLGTVRPVRRRPVFQTKSTKTTSSPKKTSEEVIPLPSNWLLKKTENFALIEIKDRNSVEFRKVDALFHKTMPLTTLVAKVMRVENRTLYENYFRMKKKMKGDLPPQKEVTEMELFHGTDPKNTTPICENGFDWRRFGSAVGSKYGQGSYFARDARYSYNFSTCMMLLADVLVGSYTLGKPEYRLPPPKDAKNPQGKQFDSCVNSIQNPEVFVVFHWDQCYPKYVVEFT